MNTSIDYTELLDAFAKDKEALQKQMQEISELRLQVAGALEYIEKKINEYILIKSSEQTVNSQVGIDLK